MDAVPDEIWHKNQDRKQHPYHISPSHSPCCLQERARGPARAVRLLSAALPHGLPGPAYVDASVAALDVPQPRGARSGEYRPVRGEHRLNIEDRSKASVLEVLGEGGESEI